MENEIVRHPPLWEQALTNVLGHDHTIEPGMTLRQWVHTHVFHHLLDLLSWDPDDLKTHPTQQVCSIDDHGQVIHLTTNQVKQRCGQINYINMYFSPTTRLVLSLRLIHFIPSYLMNSPNTHLHK